MKKSNKGLTFIEVILIIVIIAIMALVAYPKYVDLKQQSEANAEAYIISSIQSALASYSAAQNIKIGRAHV